MRWRGSLTCWSADDCDPQQCAGLDRDRTHRHAARIYGLALHVQQRLKRDPHAGDLYVFRGRRGSRVT